MYQKIFVFLFLISSHLLFAQDNTLKDFPKGSTPEEVGNRVAYRFAEEGHSGRWIWYASTFTWNGALKFAAATKDENLLKLLKNKFEPLFTTDRVILPGMHHVDLNMFGSLPLELFQITKDSRYLDLGMSYADTQWEVPVVYATAAEKEWANKGYSWQTRLWIDDMYMITIVQTHAYKMTGNQKYIDRAAKEMVLYLDELQQPNGLFYHAPDVPFYWGRGNGWMAAGMAELLRYLPENSQYRPPIMEGYRKMMESLKNYQAQNGLWNQLIDESDCWTETSGSAMFTFAFIEGVKNGWLDAKEYAPAARKAWMALVTYIDEQGAVREVCVGTNKRNDKKYYYDRPRIIGDYHGQAPYLWCAVALLEE